MQIGLIGLGKMGGNMRERLRNAGHTVLGYDTTPRSPTWRASLTWSRSWKHRAPYG